MKKAGAKWRSAHKTRRHKASEDGNDDLDDKFDGKNSAFLLG